MNTDELLIALWTLVWNRDWCRPWYDILVTTPSRPSLAWAPPGSAWGPEFGGDRRDPGERAYERIMARRRGAS